ncbi:alpha/beta hydrolase [Glycomyces sp. TRM65418]|uniref:alpha/beta fold hydrolase n=1 Tax=Glycomyces sp. TRM65418 TaxID=2867006 RepID=UPI001CE715C2|nr:alpha/beta hydrolase [Glycomyces sp. TRM65418]MCC3764149.1 alpha/beta hydrolase [Glycomyces sp. TRM65418]QZD53834.1 alpha/beta hydrolase [Glycomyces sp. TRM65418]
MTEPKTHTLAAPGAVLHYDVRDGDGTKPALLLVGSPMAAAGFTTLAGHFTDRAVITYDPRGSERSRRTDGADESTPDEHADDLRRIIEAVGASEVDLFASSGGAVNALALVARRPELVRTLVAHEPPATQELPDREAALAVCEDIRRTYLDAGFGPAMAKFIALVTHSGPVTEAYLEQPAPDPAAFGLPTEDDGTRDDPLLGQNIVTCNAYQHDFQALSAASTRIVVAVGAESGEELPARAGRAVATRLGIEPEVFPSHHGGFLGGEYGQTGEPEAFAAKLREVLDV